jgi:hypothetical protein
MSSPDVRDAINEAVKSASAPLPVYDLSDWNDSRDILQSVSTKCVIVQYVVADEEMMNISSEGNQGWEQTGTVVVHYVEPSGYPSRDALTVCENIRNQLRGRRVDDKTAIEECSPFTDFGSSSFGLEGGAWKGWASNLFYRRRDCG